MKRKMMDASRGARYKLNNPNVPDSDHKTPQAQNKAIGRALRSFEDANSDSMENQEKMNRKMKRKSDANARKERETDQGFKAAMKESLIDKVVEKLGEGAFKRMVTDKQEKERLAKMKKPQGNNRSYMTPKVDKYGRSNKHYFHPSEDAQSDARRDAKMDSRGLAPTKKDKPDMQHKGKKAGDEKDGGHIVMQLRKAVSINKPVKFKDGKSHNISKADAHKYLNKYMQAKKPADKEKMHSAHDSHDSFKKHLESIDEMKGMTPSQQLRKAVKSHSRMDPKTGGSNYDHTGDRLKFAKDMGIEVSRKKAADAKREVKKAKKVIKRLTGDEGYKRVKDKAERGFERRNSYT